MFSAKQIQITYYAISGLYTLAASLIWGVNTLFLLQAGLDIFEVFIVNGFFMAGMAAFEIPTGVFADTLGRRSSFLFSVFTLSLGTFAYVLLPGWGGGVSVFIVVSIFLGLGFTFYSGAVEAWLVDALKSVGYRENLDNVFAVGGRCAALSMIIGSIGGGLLGTVSLTLPYYFRAATLILLLIVAYFFMPEIGFKPEKLTLSQYGKKMALIARDSVVFGFGQSGPRLLILTSFVANLTMMWAFYGWPPLLLGLLGQDDAVWIAGLIAATVGLSEMGGSFIAMPALRVIGKRSRILLMSALAQMIGGLIIGWAAHFLTAVAGIVVMMVATGLQRPTKQSLLHSLIPSEKRATIISFDSLVGSSGGFVGQSGLGYVSRVFSLQSGYLLGGLFFGLAAPFFAAFGRLKTPQDKLKPTNMSG